jgi:hypothetical protein
MTSKAAPTTGMLSVYNGQQCVGHLMRRGKCGVEAFDTNEVSIGVFASHYEAIQALTVATKANGPHG